MRRGRIAGSMAFPPSAARDPAMKPARCRPNFAWIAALAAALSACGGSENAFPPAARVDVPPDPADKWTLATPASVDMDPTILALATAQLTDANGISAVLVTRRGQPVVEQYWNGYGKDSLHDLRSVTKSITSLLVGIAIDRHALGGVDDALAPWLAADYPGAPVLARGLVLEDLLTMRSGLACNDWNGDSPGNEEHMYKNQDWVAFWASLPQATTPGTVASYCTGNPVALGHVLANATHQPVPAFAQANLLGPLGITSALWNTYDNGTQTDTGGHMRMRPRDMVKIGQLALNRGQWNGVQLVSSAWMDASTRLHTQFDADPDDGYGYLWWHGSVTWKSQSLDMFFANGAGGQYIFVVPQLEIVAVFTGENYTNDFAKDVPYMILENDIVSAVQ